MAVEKPTSTSLDKSVSDPRRTRRNVMAMAGIVASAALTGGGCKPGEGDGSGGCLLAGTRVSTKDGEVLVQDLRVGDLLPTVSGKMLPVRQIHNWTVERQSDERWGDDVAPIKVSRSALGPDFPCRDLYLSPLHALYVDGVLIKVANLINGRSIARCTGYEAAKLSYFHIEFDDHQVVFAEGAPVESRLDDSMKPFAPVWGGGRRFELSSRLRSAVSPWYDKRRAFEKVRDRIEAHLEA